MLQAFTQKEPMLPINSSSRANTNPSDDFSHCAANPTESDSPVTNGILLYLVDLLSRIVGDEVLDSRSGYSSGWPLLLPDRPDDPLGVTILLFRFCQQRPY